jgi:hypothetical protein
MSRIILACALAGILGAPAFGQQAPVDPEEGIYQLNVAKSTLRGPIPKSQTLYMGKETYTVIGFSANGRPFSIVYPIINTEGQSRPVTGSPAYDTQSVTRLDPYTIKTVRTKDGKVIQTLISIYNPDAKTITVSAIGAVISAVMVFEKQ